jgi:hypothetical protein
MEESGNTKEEWLKSFLQLPHDTFNLIFSALNPEGLEDCFME